MKIGIHWTRWSIVIKKEEVKVFKMLTKNHKSFNCKIAWIESETVIVQRGRFGISYCEEVF